MDALLLSGGLGTRLRPLTNDWPKCLMPISGVPLIDYWLFNLKKSGFKRIFINTHWHHKIVSDYLGNSKFGLEIILLHEPKLLGTAGTLRTLKNFCCCDSILLAHADNFCSINLIELVKYHFKYLKPITMVTFDTDKPHECGIVVTDVNGVVTKFYEKDKNPPSQLANAAIYIIEPSVIDWVLENDWISDFSNQVLPKYLNEIISYKHNEFLIDIGVFERLKMAQSIESREFLDMFRFESITKISAKPFLDIKKKLKGI